MTHAAPVREALLYTRLATSQSGVMRSTAKAFFRLCGTVGPLRCAIFEAQAETIGSVR